MRRSACVIEVKYRVHPTEIPALIQKKLTFIRKETPKYSQIYFGIASMATSDLVIQMAQKEGICLLTQGGGGTVIAVGAGGDDTGANRAGAIYLLNYR